MPMSLWLLRGHNARQVNYEKRLKAGEDQSASGEHKLVMAKSWRRREVLKDYRFYLILPALSATSLVSTALFFHHLNLADEKGWSHAFMTGNYLLYSVVATFMAVVSGQLIDRFSALNLMPFTLVPMVCALLMINLVDSYFVIWPYMVLLGIGSGFSQTTQSALWPECYGLRHLGAIKSLYWTFVVFASALGPVWLGYLVDLGNSFQQATLTMAIYLLVVTGVMMIGLRGFRSARANAR